MIRVGAVFCCVILAGCNSVSSEGPLAGAITSDAGQSSAELGRKNAAVFDIVDIDSRTARLVSDYVSSTLNRRFGIGGGVGRVVIGVGDALKVTIFEAGADGLFSTAQSKQVSLDIVVQPDGTAAIPYAGSVRFVGKTLDQVVAAGDDVVEGGLDVIILGKDRLQAVGDLAADLDHGAEADAAIGGKGPVGRAGDGCGRARSDTAGEGD